jgi:hypothetical protein
MNPLAHFLSGFVGKSDRQDILGPRRAVAH